MVVKEALRIVFDPEGGPLQEILIKEGVRLSGASAASAINSSLAVAFQEVRETPWRLFLHFSDNVRVSQILFNRITIERQTDNIASLTDAHF